MTRKKQTSSAVSSIAGRYVRMTNAQMFSLVSSGPHENDTAALQFFRDIRKLAASCLSQDVTRGQDHE